MLYNIENAFLRISADTYGAELKSITGHDKTEYLWHSDGKYWDGRATILFPTCGRLWGGIYTYSGKSYSLPIHGFARSCEFSVITHTSDRLVFELESSKETRKIYPFDFRLTITYALDKSKLLFSIRTENTGIDILPFSVGWHPGFNVPLADGLAFEDYFLEFDECCEPRRLIITKDGFCAGHYEPFSLEDKKILRLDRSLFAVDGIFLAGMSASVTLKSNKDSRSVRLFCSDMTHLGIWQPAAGNPPFICIEPWHGLPSVQGKADDMATKADMIRLTPHSLHEFCCELDIT